jgi:hypothetical protein
VAQGWLDLKENLDDGKKSLDSTTQAGLDNQKGILTQIELIERRRKTEIDAANGNTATIDKANAEYDESIEHLRQMAHAAGFTDSQVDALLASYAALPAQKTTEIKTPGMAESLAQGISLGNALNNIDGRHYTATVDVRYQSYNPGIALGNLLHHARGGTMPSAGFSVVGEHGPEAVFMSRGQYVSTAEETRKLSSMMGGTSPGASGTTSLAVAVMPGAEHGVGQLVQYLLDRGLVQFFDSNGKPVTTRRG